QAFRDWDAKHSAGSLERLADQESRAPYASWNIDPEGGSGAQLTRPTPSSRLNTLSRSLAFALCEPHSSGVFASGADLAPGSLLALVRTGIENDFEEVVFPQN